MKFHFTARQTSRGAQQLHTYALVNFAPQQALFTAPFFFDSLWKMP